MKKFFNINDNKKFYEQNKNVIDQQINNLTDAEKLIIIDKKVLKLSFDNEVLDVKAFNFEYLNYKDVDIEESPFIGIPGTNTYQIKNIQVNNNIAFLINPSFVYEGKVNTKNEAHGKGKFTLPDGTTREGFFKDGRQNGYGKVTFPDGLTAEGLYKDWRQNGWGKVTYPENIGATWIIEEGIYKEGKPAKKLSQNSEPSVISTRRVKFNGEKIENSRYIIQHYAEEDAPKNLADFIKIAPVSNFATFKHKKDQRLSQSWMQ